MLLNADTPADQPASLPHDAVPTHDPAQILRMLAALTRFQAPTVEAAISLRLQCLMDMLGVRSAFVSALSSEAMYVVNAQDRGGCNIPSGGVVPLEETFCQYVRAGGAPVVIGDAAHDARVAEVATRRDFNIGSYIGVPVLLIDGTSYGSLCALDPEARTFSQAQVYAMELVARDIGGLIERDQVLLYVANSATDAYEDTRVALVALDKQRTILQMVANDLRSPASSMYLSATMLQDGAMGELTPTQQAVVAQLAVTGKYMHRLVNDLVDAAAVEDPLLSLITSNYDAVALGCSLVDAWAPQAHEARLTLVCVAQAETLPLVGDPDRVRQALTNLISNALAYTAEGGVTLTVAPCDEGVLFSVVDSGPGIAPDELARIWQPRVRTSRQPGLGLYVVAQLARHMGGSVGAESTLGQGSRFWLQVPLQGPRPQRVAL